MATFEVNLNNPLALMAFLGELSSMESRVAIGGKWASLFWKIYQAAKLIPEPTTADMVSHFGKTVEDSIRNGKAHPEMDFKTMFPKGRVWKDGKGTWWFYFN